MLGFGGYPQAPAKESCALSGLSRPDGCSTVLRPISWGRMACARAPSRRPLTPLTGSGPVGFGGIPKPPPKRAAPSLDSPAPDGSSAVLRPISWGAWPRARVRFRRPPTPLTGSGTGGGGVPPSPRQRELRPLWTLPPGWEFCRPPTHLVGAHGHTPVPAPQPPLEGGRCPPRGTRGRLFGIPPEAVLNLSITSPSA